MKNKKIDKQFQCEVITRDQRCVKCGTTEALSAHHIIKRSFKRCRHDKKNGVTLCIFCHAWAHANTKDSRKLFINYLIDIGEFPNTEKYYEYYLIARGY